MRRFDPQRSWAVLIGTSRYTSDPGLSPLPAVRNNLDALRTVLTDQRYCGFARDRCTVISDPEDSQAIGRALAAAGDAAEDLLLVYYAGHGLIDRQGELYLGLTETSSHTSMLPYTGVPYGLVRRSVRGSRAASRVVILDCCFSGRAIDAATGPEAVVAGQVEIQGAYTLTSSSRTSTSIAAEGSQFTAFTGELLRILVDGVPGGPELLTLDAIYEELHRGLVRAGLPEPHVGREQNIHRLALVRNAASAGPETTLTIGAPPGAPHVPGPAGGISGHRRAPSGRWNARAIGLTAGASAALGVAVVLAATLLPGGASKTPEAASRSSGVLTGTSAPPSATAASPSSTSSASPAPRGSAGGPTTTSAGHGPPAKPTVPAGLVGAPLGTAVDRLSRLKIPFDTQYEASANRNQIVLRVGPGEGTELAADQHVRLYVARQYTRVPDLVGMTRDELQTWAAGAGMHLDTRVIQDSVCAEQTCDTAVSQDRKACSRVFLDETVVVTLGTASRVPHERTVCS
ncbi:caspase, EACC1-associated type [Actinomadura scrupuli]|uniref:caspase, EACC1-associated type n=1 Tax=Actinomadura scrupuli TaxID=559629 RepID=UPI003D9914D4